VFLHVGAPKTGTSQLQDLLFLNRDVLREHGVLYPAERFDDHFMAALDLLGKEWGGLEERAPGAWDRLVAGGQRVRGTHGGDLARGPGGCLGRAGRDGAVRA
jgi:hypothetical protein